MTGEANPDTDLHATATGHALSGTTWLDAHFEQSRAIYEAMLAATPLEAGWHVLDAGSGSGSFLPALADRVGPTGHLTALDLDAENLAITEQRMTDSPLHCPLAVAHGSVTSLPVPDATFDAVWCANVSQYLTDAELDTALAEFRRVVRPGGVVAVKEADGVSWHYAPMDPGIWWRTAIGGLAAGAVQAHGTIRSAVLRRWLERAGLQGVWQQVFPEEIWAPLTPVQHQYIGDFLRFIATVSESADMPEADRVFWQAQREPEQPDALVNHPDFYHRGGYVLAVGYTST